MFENGIPMIEDLRVENCKFDNEMTTIKNTLFSKTIPERYPDSCCDSMGYYNPSAFKWRSELVEISSFPMVSWSWIRPLAKFIGTNPVMEIMAGRGVISRALKDCSVNITANDNFTWEWGEGYLNKKRLTDEDLWFPIEIIDAVEAIKRDGPKVKYIICSWPPYCEPIAYEALMAMREVNPKCKMIYIGEGQGGCTADDKFFENAKYFNIGNKYLAEAESEFQSWCGIHDRLSIYQ